MQYQNGSRLQYEEEEGEDNHGSQQQKGQALLRPSPQEQARIVKGLEAEGEQWGTGAVGDTWYLLSWQWWSLWKAYVRYDADEEEDEENSSNGERATKQRRLKREQEEAEEEDEDQGGSGGTLLPPDPIDNRELLEADKRRLKPNLLQNEQYQLVTPKTWNALHSWYGGGPALPRQVIEVGRTREKMVEVYPLSFRVFRLPEEERPPTSSSAALQWKEQSRKATVGQLRKELAQQFGLLPHKVRLWALSFEHESGHKVRTKYHLLREDNAPLEDCRFVDNQPLLLECQRPDSTWLHSDDLTEKSNLFLPAFFPPPPSPGRGHNHSSEASSINARVTSRPSSSSASSSSSSASSSSSSSSSASSLSFLSVGDEDDASSSGLSKADSGRGVCGLSNLGNTCFMNSALQCLSNTAPLTRYFLEGRYIDELNRTNPLGMGGEIALQYGALLKKLWSNKYSSVSPSEFKWALGKFAPQFSGYRQHDSQELLAFLLDGLHEDLNRVEDKPYVETQETDGKEDAVAAEEAWQNHLKRNRSIIVDLFQGQLKSTVECPDCNKISITFDPFLYLSLPLPTELKRTMKVTLFAQGKPARRYALSVPKSRGKVLDLKEALSQVSGIPPERLTVVEVYHNKIYTTFTDSKSLSNIHDTELIHAYENTSQGEEGEEDGTTRSLQILQKARSASTYYGGSMTGYPRLISYNPEDTCRHLYELVWRSFYSLLCRDGDDVEERTSNGRSTPGTPMDMEQAAEIDLASIFSLQPSTPSGSSMGPKIPCSDEPLSGHLSKNTKLLCLEWAKGYPLREDKEALQLDSSVTAQGSRPDGGVDLNACLDLFLTREKLSKEDEWYCPRCRAFKQATKKFDLWKMPEILVVHLKRFQYSKWWRDKLGTMVDFPTQGWDLTNAVVNRDQPLPCYDLFAVSNHSGGLGGGHYTATCRNMLDKRWYSFNDSFTRRVDEQDTQSPSAYVLFYRRRQTSASSSTSSSSSSPMQQQRNDESTT